ncbi:MAG: acetyl-CoA hydrolase/transferase C-terminal domain-containing protein [Paracoccaceae bacterium]
MAPTPLSEILSPGDRIVVGQAAGEPVGLIEELFKLAPTLGSVDVFCGLSLNPVWERTVPDALHVSTYVGLGCMRNLVARRRARVVPASLSQISSLFASRKLPVDVVLLQVSPADAEGYHSLGCTLDYVWEAAQMARDVVVEVNETLPVTRGTKRFHSDHVTVARHSAAPLPQPAAEQISAAQRQVAQQVKTLIPDGATLQLGIGGLANAVAGALAERRGLKIRSGMVGDWFVDLVENGAIDTDTPDACLASIALGSARLYDFLSDQTLLSFALPSQLVEPIPASHLMAINSGIEVDLVGQVNTELIGARYVGTVGGQTDYFRAARQSAGGVAILALAASAGCGKSRIVARCDHVTTAQSEVDVIVTEYGVADIRNTTLKERKALIAAIADPHHRVALNAGQDPNKNTTP